MTATHSTHWRKALTLAPVILLSLALAACGGRSAGANEPPQAEATAPPAVAPATAPTETPAEMPAAAPTADSPAAMPGMAAGEHNEAATGEDMAAMHNIPAEAAALPNPVPATAESVARGAEIFSVTCAVCHGATGQGDGPAGVALDPRPANLTAEHVQENTDGALFYTISHGVPGTAMVAWEAQFSEEERWSLVNFVRTLPGAQ